MADFNVILELYQGVDFTNTFSFFGPDPSGFGNPVNAVPRDFTDCVFRMMVRLANDPTSPVILSLTSPSGGLVAATATFVPGPPTPSAPNGVAITVTRAQSLTIATTYPLQRQFAYDLMADNTFTGTTELLLCGAFFVVPTVSR